MNPLVTRLQSELAARSLKRQFPWTRFWEGVLATIVFIVVASGSLMYALGYRFDDGFSGFYQVANVELNSPLNGRDIKVYLNGELVKETLPARLVNVQPGPIQIEITAPGYQNWAYATNLEPNERLNVSSVILLYENPTTTPVSALEIRERDFVNRNYDGVDIRAENELWYEDELQARYSSNIKNQQWLPGKKVLAMQIGNRIVYFYTSLQATQTVATFPDSIERPFTIQENGRVLIYKDTDDVYKKVELFEGTRLFELP